MKKKKKKYLKIFIPENIKTGVFSNIAQVSSTDEIIVMDFVFITPENNNEGNMVSRVILTTETARELNKILTKNLE